MSDDERKLFANTLAESEADRSNLKRRIEALEAENKRAWAIANQKMERNHKRGETIEALTAELKAVKHDLERQMDIAREAINELEAVKRERDEALNPSEEHCATCGAPKSNHPYRHPFKSAALKQGEDQ